MPYTKPHYQYDSVYVKPHYEYESVYVKPHFENVGSPYYSSSHQNMKQSKPKASALEKAKSSQQSY